MVYIYNIFFKAKKKCKVNMPAIGKYLCIYKKNNELVAIMM